MKGKRRTSLPRPPVRKRKKGTKPAPPRPNGHDERLAVRRCAAMKYRLAGASYRTIAEKLTEELAQAYADEHGVSFERSMKKITHVSKRTVWDDVTAEMEELRSETQIQRGDLIALENARVDQVFSKALSLFANGRVPAGRLALATMGRRCLFVAGSLPVRVPQRAGVEVRAPNAPAPTIRKSVLLKNTASLALLRFFAAQGGEPAPASRFRSGT